MSFNMTLGRKIGVGIALPLLLMVAVGAAGYLGLNRVMTVTVFYQQVSEIRAVLSSAKGHMDEFLLACSMGEVDQQQKLTEAVHRDLNRARDSIRSLAAAAGLEQSAGEALSTADGMVEKYRSSLDEYTAIEKEKGKIDIDLRSRIESLLQSIEKGTLFHADMVTACKVLNGVLTGYLVRSSEATWKGVEAETSRLEKAVTAWSDLVSNSNELRALSETIKAQFGSLTAQARRHQGYVVQQSKTRIQMRGHKNRLDDLCTGLGHASVESLHRETVNSLALIIGFVLIALALGILSAWLITRAITGPLKRGIRGLSESAEQVSAASYQISLGSQTLSQGANEQAASIKETSTALEKLGSAARRAAQLTQGAERLMNENIEKSGQSLKNLVGLTQKMSQIEMDSDKISHIIKTIDEIAFQTNLLALNAAVEAARAGEAGAGFAVVADEVRNLAIRTTEAAKNTQELLDMTVKRVAEATHSIKDLNRDFEGIIESATVMGEKTAAVTASSEGQATEIELVSKAAKYIEQNTQIVAKTAHESAAASEELRAQTEEVRCIVNDFIALVSGKGMEPSAGADEGLRDLTGERDAGMIDGGEGKHLP
jgi:methyl-accepting chemotaxis protein